MGTNVVIYTPATNVMIKLAICSRLCQELDYEAIAIVRGDWGEAMDYLTSGQAQVIVVAEDDDLPPDRTPRVEVVSHMRPNDGPDVYRPGPNRNDRTRIIPRGGAR
jgi:hypothetical protein